MGTREDGKRRDHAADHGTQPAYHSQAQIKMERPAENTRPDIVREVPRSEKAYGLFLKLVDIFNRKTSAGVARLNLARWYNEVSAFGNNEFDKVLETFENHNTTIINYFERRLTNASAESFNAKIKAFRTQFRGVGDIKFFMFRLATLYSRQLHRPPEKSADPLKADKNQVGFFGRILYYNSKILLAHTCLANKEKRRKSFDFQRFGDLGGLEPSTH